ncbi:MAG: DUF2000 domain-containing protein [Chlamydiales bacterium]|nr:DUF2000 domain-containing protein [Chlamydiales bacterium]
MDTPFPKKLVAIMNEKIEPGVLMNALAHMCIGFGAHLGAEALQLIDYIDADGNRHPNISKMPFIILKANSNKIRNLRISSVQEGIEYAVFTNTMTIGSWQDQVEKTKITKELDLNYYGIVLFGDWAKVTELTKKFSLLK